MNLTILKTRSDLENWRKQSKNQPIHFVPTMGCLHQGHKALIKAAKFSSKEQPARVLVSIFVNPLQFAKGEDFSTYPRNLEQDCKTAMSAGANAIWAPEFETLFPKGKEHYFTIKAPSSLKECLCGAHRKNHFDGVATIVLRLLNFVRPKQLYLGEKDWQQLVILRQLVKELGLQVEVRSIPTVRDKDGLAYSSRNKYLTAEERAKALTLPKLLIQESIQFQSNKDIDLNKLCSILKKNDLDVEYLETVDCKSLTPVNYYKSKFCLLAAAVHCGNTRLIDHIFLMNRKPIVAIDGPAGAGKSTVTKGFAKRLGLIYLDTGAMYRAVTWFIQKENINPDNEKELVKALSTLNVDINLADSGIQHVMLNDQEISNEIRHPKVTAAVSKIASKAAVRKKLTAQQKFIGLKGGIVAEGRDIGSTVFPDAELKVFLTASSGERARRRANDLINQGFSVPNLQELENEIQERDKIDSTREIAPLVKAKDAKELVTDGMTIDKVIDTLIRMFREEIPAEVWPSKQL